MCSHGHISKVLTPLNSLYVKEKKMSSCYLLKMLESTLFRNILIDIGTTMTEFCKGGREIGLSSKYSLGKEQDGNQWTENY